MIIFLLLLLPFMTGSAKEIQDIADKIPATKEIPHPKNSPKNQPKSNPPLNLAQILDIALSNNPITKKAWWNARRAAAAMGGVESSLYPKIGVQIDARHSREIKYPNGSSTTFSYAAAELALSYLLFDFGERNAAISAARSALTAACWQEDWEIQKVLYQATAAYYEYLCAEELLQARLESLNDAETALSYAEQLCEVGLRSVTDLYTSKSSLARIQIDIAQQKAHLEIAKGRLAAVMGLPADTKIDAIPPLEDPSSDLPEEDIELLITHANRVRADLLARRAEVSERYSDWERADKSSRLRVRLLGDTGVKQHMKHEGNGFNYNAMVVIEVPLFTGFEYTYQKRYAYANLHAAEAELKQLELDISLEILTYSQLLKAAKEGLKLSHEYMEFAMKSYEGVLENYRAGILTIFEVLEAQKALADARIRQTTAHTQWYLSLAQLAYATGTISGSQEGSSCSYD
jgi:outer membrane protein TolC